jgi:lipoprotein-anchoring transpeptidase ErfK/SrfK
VAVPPAPVETVPPTPAADVKPLARTALPAGSGSGRRIVYGIAAQQVWLVDGTNAVTRTYLVSGSKYDQLEPGTYEVFSKSELTTSWHGAETMEYMVRFHRGARANIGFHDIPVDTSTGAEVQTLSELGTPLSDGCIRQDVTDAKALWDFAPVGTPVVVLP